ncbi:MAG: hypothetical protein ABL957_03080 [Parvularculaceae bacterium]
MSNPLLPIAFGLVLAVAACGASSRDGGPPVKVSVEAATDGPWRVEYVLARPVERLNLGPALDGFRSSYWRVSAGGAALIEEGGSDWLAASEDGGAFDHVVIEVEPRSAPLAKDYQAFTPMGAGGVLLYTGHFTPKTDDGGLIETRFDIVAPQRGRIAAFDKTARALMDWASPYDLPGFVYIGSAKPAQSDWVSAIVDARAPEWVKRETETLIPPLFAAYAAGLGRDLPARPNLFVAMGDVSIEGQISYRGDALPGQFQATLEGGAWTQDSPEARRVFLYTTAHEAAHLFQLTVQPDETASDFIHEGGADALAAEALVHIGRWTRSDLRTALVEALAECARLTEGRSLIAAEAAEDWRAAYACGHVLTVAAAGREGPAAFWRRLMMRAEGAEGYDTALFLEVARETAGAETADAISSFLRTNEARPDAKLDRIFALSGAEP